MGLGDSGEFRQGHIGETSAHIDLSLRDQIQGLLEWHFDVVARANLILVFSDWESDVVFTSAPFGVGLFYTFVIEAEVVSDDVFDALGLGALQAQVEKAALLREEPLA